MFLIFFSSQLKESSGVLNINLLPFVMRRSMVIGENVGRTKYMWSNNSNPGMLKKEMILLAKKQKTETFWGFCFHNCSYGHLILYVWDGRRRNRIMAPKMWWYACFPYCRVVNRYLICYTQQSCTFSYFKFRANALVTETALKNPTVV